VHETDEEITDLQRLLDASIGRASGHLTGIVTDDHRLDARQLVTELTGMKVLVLATVTARGEPRTSCVDGHFVHGRWLFGTAATAIKVKHMRARPAVSATYVDGERIGVFTHGTAHVVSEGPEFEKHNAYFTDYYGSDPQTWDETGVVYATIEPSWMVAYASDPASFPHQTDADKS
jgi:general stress protein 26